MSRLGLLQRARDLLRRIKGSPTLARNPNISALARQLATRLTTPEGEPVGAETVQARPPSPAVAASVGAEQFVPQVPPPIPPDLSGPDILNQRVLNKAREMWRLAGGQLQAFVSYLREVPDPELNELLSRPQELEAIVRQILRSPPDKPQPPGDGFPPTQLQSSNVAGFRFNPKSQQLQVKFHNGSVYQYEGVPPIIYSLFSKGNASATTNGGNQYGSWWIGKNPSLGAAVWQYLRAGGFPYARLQ